MNNWQAIYENAQILSFRHNACTIIWISLCLIKMEFWQSMITRLSFPPRRKWNPQISVWMMSNTVIPSTHMWFHNLHSWHPASCYTHTGDLSHLKYLSCILYDADCGLHAKPLFIKIFHYSRAKNFVIQKLLSLIQTTETVTVHP